MNKTTNMRYAAVDVKKAMKELVDLNYPYMDRIILYEMGYILVNRRGKNKLVARKDRV